MSANLTRLTHKIAIYLHLVAEGCNIYILAPHCQSGNFLIHHRMLANIKKRDEGTKDDVSVDIVLLTIMIM
jgi:hypothetical protein